MHGVENSNAREELKRRHGKQNEIRSTKNFTVQLALSFSFCELQLPVLVVESSSKSFKSTVCCLSTHLNDNLANEHRSTQVVKPGGGRAHTGGGRGRIGFRRGHA